MRGSIKVVLNEPEALAVIAGLTGQSGLTPHSAKEKVARILVRRFAAKCPTCGSEEPREPLVRVFAQPDVPPPAMDGYRLLRSGALRVYICDDPWHV